MGKEMMIHNDNGMDPDDEDTHQGRLEAASALAALGTVTHDHGRAGIRQESYKGVVAYYNQEDPVQQQGKARRLTFPQKVSPA